MSFEELLRKYYRKRTYNQGNLQRIFDCLGMKIVGILMMETRDMTEFYEEEYHGQYDQRFCILLSRAVET